jgi:hypothetical protein
MITGDLKTTYYVGEDYRVTQKTTFIGKISNYMDLHSFPFDSDWIVFHGG